MPHLKCNRTQITPSDTVRGDRAAAAHPKSPEDAAATAAAAAEATDNLRIAHVPTVVDDHSVLATLALRDVLAGHLRHHLDPGSPPLVVAGPFGSGKRLLLQRMLSLYPTGFQLVPVYTTAAVESPGGSLRHVGADFVAGLEEQGLIAFRMEALGHPYVASRADVCECARPLLHPILSCCRRLHDHNVQTLCPQTLTPHVTAAHDTMSMLRSCCAAV